MQPIPVTFNRLNNLLRRFTPFPADANRQREPVQLPCKFSIPAFAEHPIAIVADETCGLLSATYCIRDDVFFRAVRP